MPYFSDIMKKLILFFTILFSLVEVHGADGILTAQNRVNTGGYRFWFYNPDPMDELDPKPVVIFLHGRSLSGNDLSRVKKYGTIAAIEKGRDIDAYVIAPQVPSGAFWEPEKVMDILDWAWDNYNIDEDRVYIIGMSLGGFGAIDVANAYPDRIAACLAMCGGSYQNDFSGLAQVPLWVIHGTADAAVPVSQSDRVVSEVKKVCDEDRVIYQRIPGMNHSRPARYFYIPEVYDWLMSHSLQDKGRPVNRNVLNTDAANTAYRGLKSNSRKL